MISAKRFCASSGVMLGVLEELDEQVVELVVRVLRLMSWLVQGMVLPGGEDVEALLHAVVGGREVDVAAHRQRALLQVEGDLGRRDCIMVEASTSCACVFSGSSSFGK